MRVVIGLLFITQPPQRLDDVVLRIALPRVNYVVNAVGVAEMRMLRLALDRRSPALVGGISMKRQVAEILAQQTELPKVICNVLADVRHRPA